MIKVFRKNNFIKVHFSNGKTFTSTKCTDDMWSYIGQNYDNEKKLKQYLLKESDKEELLKSIKASHYLTLKGSSVYMTDISEISMPENLVSKILDAEEKNDQKELTKLRNFWRLVSMNPDARVRNNIFWFIRKWGLKLSESGFIIAYRNADIKQDKSYSTSEVKEIINSYYTNKYIQNKDPKHIYYKNTTLEDAYKNIMEGNQGPVYTDHHSHSFNIKLGQPVSMPREDTDTCQENTCSRGLHVASAGWLSQNYFGSVGMQVLVNPMNIVAVPPEDSYGKMRTCEYFPVCLIDFDSKGNVIEPEINLYNDIQYLQNLKIEGKINNEDVDHYTLVANNYQSREDIYDSILQTLKQK